MSVHPRPTVSWKENSKEYHVCVGASLSPKIILTGKAPFAVRYSVSVHERREVKTITTTKLEDFIPLGPFADVGLHEIYLLEAEDNNGCKFG